MSVCLSVPVLYVIAEATDHVYAEATDQCVENVAGQVNS